MKSFQYQFLGVVGLLFCFTLITLTHNDIIIPVSFFTFQIENSWTV